MNYVFAIFMVIVAMMGGWWLFKLSDDNGGDAAVSYGLAGAVWAGACLAVALKVL